MGFGYKQFLESYGGSAGAPGLVTIKLPDSVRSAPIVGILASETTFTGSNQFGPLIPNISFLADVFQMWDSASLPTWIGATAQAWKGTDPIRFPVDMYLINYSPDTDSESSLRALFQMCSLSQAPNLAKTGTSEWTITAHGGYEGDFLDGNAAQFKAFKTDTKHKIEGILSGGASQSDEQGENTEVDTEPTGDNARQQVENYLNDLGKYYDEGGSARRGTIQVTIGNSNLSDLLLTSIAVTPSLVQVGRYSPERPLYYRVDLKFTSSRAALSTELNALFGGKN